MAMPQDEDARKFHRAATERLEDARTLAVAGRHQGALYLAGYAIECALKALLLERTPPKRRAVLLLTFRGVGGHDYGRLRVRLAERGVLPGPRERAAFVDVRRWDTSLRYDPARGDAAEIRVFLAAAVTILTWVERSF